MPLWTGFFFGSRRRRRGGSSGPACRSRGSCGRSRGAAPGAGPPGRGSAGSGRPRAPGRRRPTARRRRPIRRGSPTTRGATQCRMASTSGTVIAPGHALLVAAGDQVADRVNAGRQPAGGLLGRRDQQDLVQRDVRQTERPQQEVQGRAQRDVLHVDRHGGRCWSASRLPAPAGPPGPRSCRSSSTSGPRRASGCLSRRSVVFFCERLPDRRHPGRGLASDEEHRLLGGDGRVLGRQPRHLAERGQQVGDVVLHVLRLGNDQRVDVLERGRHDRARPAQLVPSLRPDYRRDRCAPGRRSRSGPCPPRRARRPGRAPGRAGPASAFRPLPAW